MDLITYDVTVYELRTEGHKGDREVRWRLGGEPKPRTKTFPTRGQAEAHRNDLLTAIQRGLAFQVTSGLPAHLTRPDDTTWHTLAVAYRARWQELADNSVRSATETLITTTTAMIRPNAKGRPGTEAELRLALRHCVFQRNLREPTPRQRALIDWAAANSRPVRVLLERASATQLLDTLASKLDGTPAAHNYYKRRRTSLSNIIKFAIAEKILTEDPFGGVSNKRHAKATIDPVNRDQLPSNAEAAAMLRWFVAHTPKLAAFFALLLLAGLRPSEATNLRVKSLRRLHDPDPVLVIEEAAPAPGKGFSKTGEARAVKDLKARRSKEVRYPPAAPVLVRLLEKCLAERGLTMDSDPGALLFVAVRSGGLMPDNFYRQAWRAARAAALPAEDLGRVRAARPYDARHFCATTWLQAGIEEGTVADWLGHSVAELRRTYQGCVPEWEQQHQKQATAAMSKVFGRAI